MRFTILARSRATSARLGRVETPHGSFDTPAFMPVGTKGTVKGLLPWLVAQAGSEIVLNNTYHLLLRPGSDLVQRRGGVHAFMGWPGPILTDSGGYQAFSMSDMNRVDDDGVTFKSIVDGSMIRLTPERATQVQNELGADIIMAFDDCPPAADVAAKEAPGGGGWAGQADPRATRAIQRDAGKKGYDHAARLRIANERTVRWLERCKAAHARASEQALFGIVQGGTDLAERSWSAERITNVELPGYAIGGVAVGEDGEAIARVVGHTAPLLPEAKPRYLMGVGYERDIVAAVRSGVDMFDCVLPTRNGRNACAFTPTGPVRLRNAQFAEDDRVIEPGCDCHACDPWRRGWGDRTPGFAGMAPPKFTRAYLRHLFMAEEMLGPILVSLHNVRYFQRLMLDVRRTIADDDWPGLWARWAVLGGSPPVAGR